MAKIRTGDAGFNIAALGVERSDDILVTEDVFQLKFGPGDTLRLFGDYQFDQQGNLTGGTVESFVKVAGGQFEWSVTGIGAPAGMVLNGLFQEDLTPLIQGILSGADTFLGGEGQDVMIGFGGNDILRGNGGTDFLLGGDDDDRLFGGAMNDALVGDAGDDRLLGEAGDDRLYGGLGADWLEGGAGADRYIFASADDSTAAARDRIVGFDGDSDVLDLSQIDANELTAGVNDAFTLVNRFHGVAGELTITERPGGNFLLSADTDGDKVADFSLLFTGVVSAPALDNGLVL
jgi:Ca2+-binding RTX toxin-like protein